MFDHKALNVTDSGGRLLCPCCGFPDYTREPAYDVTGGIIGTTICPCCLWEPGFDDDPLASAQAEPTALASLRNYREHWRQKLTFLGPKKLRPAGWNGTGQLDALFALAPHLR